MSLGLNSGRRPTRSPSRSTSVSSRALSSCLACSARPTICGRAVRLCWVGRHAMVRNSVLVAADAAVIGDVYGELTAHDSWHHVGKHLFADYAARHDGDEPYVNPINAAGMRIGRGVTAERRRELLERKERFRRFLARCAAMLLGRLTTAATTCEARARSLSSRSIRAFPRTAALCVKHSLAALRRTVSSGAQAGSWCESLRARADGRSARGRLADRASAVCVSAESLHG